MGLSFRLGLRLRMRKKKKMKVEGRNRRSPETRPVEIPEDVVMDILARLSVNLLMMFKCVSKRWCSLISSRYFTNLFLNKAPSPPLRRLFMYVVDKKKDDYALLSVWPPKCSLENQLYVLDEVVTMPGMGGCFVNALRGLVCFRIGTRLQICNLTTKQRVELPPIIVDPDSNIWNYFGYDPLRDEYKVVNLAWEMTQEEQRVARSEHQVLVLGPGASWRRSTRSHTIPPHRPYSEGISIDEFLYYGAWTSETTCVVVIFDLTREDFNLIELPTEDGIWVWDMRATNLMNYGGKVAVFDYSRLRTTSSIYLWVLEEKTRKWSNMKNFVLPLEKLSFMFPGEFSVQGTCRKGEIRCFSNRCFSKTHPSLHVICDLDEGNLLGGVAISKVHYSSFEIESLHMNYWYDFESIMYLEA